MKLRLVRLHCLRGLLLLLGGMATAPLGADDRILVKAKLNDEPLTLAFDTGAGTTAIFSRAAEQHGVNIEQASPDLHPNAGQVVVSRTQPVKFEFFGHVYPGIHLDVINSPADAFSDIDGVLGWPTVRNNLWFFNGSEPKIELVNELPPDAAGWIKLREFGDRHVLCLELPGKDGKPATYLGIDTGADSGVRLSPKAWTDWRQAHPKQAVILEAYGMPGIKRVIAECAWADEIDIAGLKLRGVQVTSMNPVEVANHPAGTVAIFGLNAMRRMNSVFGGKDGSAYFCPLDTPPPPYDHNRLGAIFIPADPADPENPDALIAHVARGSPAAQAGVRNGDVLLMIDDYDATTWRTQPDPLPKSRFFHQAPGTKLHLTLRRSGRIVTVDVTLRNILGPGTQSR